VRSINAEVPVAVEEVVMRLLDKEPARRPDSAAETARLLDAALRAPAAVQSVPIVAQVREAPTVVIPVVAPIRVTRRRRAARSRRPLWIGVTTIALLVVGSIVYFLVRDGDTRSPDRRNDATSERGDDAWIAKVAALPVEQQAAAVAARLKELNPDFDGAFESKIEGDAVIEFRVNTDRLADITPVQVLKQLSLLRCEPAQWDSRNGRLKSLEPLRGLPLTKLYCGGNPAIYDLRPLEGMKLVDLGVHNCAVADLSPVKDMPLTRLGVWETAVSELSPLRGMRLRHLYLSGTRVRDLSVLRDMPLVELHIPRTPVSDMSPVANAPLEEIWLDYSPWRDTELIAKPTLRTINRKPADEFRRAALASAAAFETWCQSVAQLPTARQAAAVAVKLRELNPSFSGLVGPIGNRMLQVTEQAGRIHTVYVPSELVTDLSPLRAFPVPYALSCEPPDFWLGTGKLRDLWPLKGLPLRVLHCAGNPDLTDVTPLAGMPLEVLAVSGTNINDLQVTRTMPLKQLFVRRTPVSDLSPLSGKAITHLYLSEAKISDLSPLKGMKLQVAHVDMLPATDLSVLADMPLQELNITFYFQRDLALIRNPTLRTINGKPAVLFRREVGVPEP
jgi:hypothetical protein